jgi:glycosyltransferase involved in cell wall biosynthesis
MRCLYVVSEDPLSPNYRGGASAMYHDQLFALSDLGHEVDLWHFASREARERFDREITEDAQTWSAVKRRCRSARLTTLQFSPGLVERLMTRASAMMQRSLPSCCRDLRADMARQVSETRPDAIWAQHFAPAVAAIRAVQLPVVYVHHDWLYRIKALRNNRPINARQKRLEEELVKHAAAVVTGSRVEYDELTAIRGPGVHYIPVSYESVLADTSRSACARQPLLIHLGGMSATASRDGLLSFFDKAWPSVSQSGLKLRVVGDIADSPPRLKDYLSRADCTGFVSDLRSVLRPFDLNLIPWGYATGQRTRLPVAFNHSQVVVAVRAGVACYPEAQDGVNCRLVDIVEQMPGVIAEVAGDSEQRFRLGTAAKRTFETCFVRKALLPRYAEVLRFVTENKMTKGGGRWRS